MPYKWRGFFFDANISRPSGGITHLSVGVNLDGSFTLIQTEANPLWDNWGSVLTNGWRW